MAGVIDEIQTYVAQQINFAMDQRFGEFTTTGGSPYARMIDQTASIPEMQSKISEFEKAFKVIDNSITKLQGDLQKVMPDMEDSIRKLNDGREKSEASLASLSARDEQVSSKLTANFARSTRSLPSSRSKQRRQWRRSAMQPHPRQGRCSRWPTTARI